MSSMDERKKGFEAKFAHDADLKFKAESRRNRMLAEWAASKMGLSEDATAEYIKDVRRADFEEAGDDDVFRKVKADLEARGASIADAELREKMDELIVKAVDEVENG
ncbi:MAG: DUF1476 domain-containing protein [Pseudomonadota bacterium]